MASNDLLDVMDDEVWKGKNSFLQFANYSQSINVYNFRNLIGKQLLERWTLFARWRVTHRERERESENSSKKMTKTLPSFTTLMPRQPKPGYIRVQLLMSLHFRSHLKSFNQPFAICVAVNVPLRDYQFDITQSALFSNTLVALPTGLGKTLIAAVVMYNYFRWFPQGNLLCCLMLCIHKFYSFNATDPFNR